eukprot:gene8267-1536_t
MVKRLDETQMESIRETDGVVYGFYKYLWMKDHQGNSCEVNLPHTLVYCDSGPISWYFTSSKEGKNATPLGDSTCSWLSTSMPLFSLISQAEPLEKKIATFGFDTWLNQHSLIMSMSLKSQLEKLCESVVRHLKDVSQSSVVVAKMELFFKIDHDNKIWLLFCNNLKLDKEALRQYALPKRSPLANVVAARLSVKLKDPTVVEEDKPIPVDHRPFMCVMTGETFCGDQKIEVTYKLLLQHWFHQASQLNSETDRIHAVDAIPPCLRRANPNMTREYYLRHRASPSFLLATAAVCPKAAAELSRASLEDLAISLSKPLGTSMRAQSAPSSQSRRTARPLVSMYGSPPRAARPQTTPGSRRTAHPLVPSAVQTKVYNTAPRPPIPSMLMPKAKSLVATTGSTSRPSSAQETQELQTSVSLPPPALGTICENESMANSGSQAWSPRGLSGRSGSPYRSPSRNPVLPRGALDSEPSPASTMLMPPEPQAVHYDRYSNSKGFSSPAASVASSMRSTAKLGRSQGGLSQDDMKTLKELNAAYGQAEQLTQQVLAEAEEILQEQPVGRGSRGQRPGSARGSLTEEPPSLQSQNSSRRGSATRSRPVSASTSSTKANISRPSSGRQDSVNMGLPPVSGSHSLSRHGSLGEALSISSHGGMEMAVPVDDAASVLTKDEADLLSEALMGED